jgi:5,10-methylenetetrahydrofolate reductase
MTERTFSFEFFPPKTAEGAEKLDHLRFYTAFWSSTPLGVLNGYFFE